MLYRVRHQTIYDYIQPVSVSHHVVRLTPRDIRGQRRRACELSVWPVPPFHVATHIDYFGNTATSFTLPESHTRMSVEATSELEVQAVAHPIFSESPSWETVRDTVPGDHTPDGLDASIRSASQRSRSWPTTPASRFPQDGRSSRRSSISLPASIRISALTPRPRK
jgi:transglutaminase-like putative cysteine protease